jgi:hypothetical protein
MIFVFKIDFFFLMNNLTLNDMTLILSVNMKAIVSIEAYITYDKSLFF